MISTFYGRACNEKSKSDERSRIQVLRVSEIIMVELENNFLLLCVVLSTLITIVVIFCTKKNDETILATCSRVVGVFCLECSVELTRKYQYSKIITCPSCQNKMIRNIKRLIFCYASLLFLGLSFVMEEGSKWPFQLLFLILLSNGILMKELVKYQE